MRLRTGLVGLLVTASIAAGGTALAADVTVTVDAIGPAGQVNHGQVVSNLVRALKLQLNEAGRKAGIGCLVRMVAQSSHGKGDEQQGPTTTASVTGAEDLVLTLDDASCEPGDDVQASGGNGPGKGKGHAYGHSKGVGNPHSNANR